MLVTEFGILIVVKVQQPEKASDLMLITELGILIAVKALH